MDADLARASRGQAVAPETEGGGDAGAARGGSRDADDRADGDHPAGDGRPAGHGPAAVLAGDGGSTNTTNRCDGRSGRGLLAALLVAAAIVAGWYVYTKIQDQLNQTKPVSVPLVVGSVERLARDKLLAAGLKGEDQAGPERDRRDRARVRPVSAGRRAHREGNLVVDLRSRAGSRRSRSRNVVGKQSTDAAAALAERGLKANVHYVHSEKDSGIVTGQFPKVGHAGC
jgi:hypothetical protein